MSSGLISICTQNVAFLQSHDEAYIHHFGPPVLSTTFLGFLPMSGHGLAVSISRWLFLGPALLATEVLQGLVRFLALPNFLWTPINSLYGSARCPFWACWLLANFWSPPTCLSQCRQGPSSAHQFLYSRHYLLQPWFHLGIGKGAVWCRLALSVISMGHAVIYVTAFCFCFCFCFVLLCENV